MYDIKILLRRVVFKALGALLLAALLLFLSRFFPPEMAIQMQTKAFEMVMALVVGGGLLGVIEDLGKFFDFKDSAKAIGDIVPTKPEN